MITPALSQSRLIALGGKPKTRTLLVMAETSARWTAQIRAFAIIRQGRVAASTANLATIVREGMLQLSTTSGRPKQTGKCKVWGNLSLLFLLYIIPLSVVCRFHNWFSAGFSAKLLLSSKTSSSNCGFVTLNYLKIKL
jgi:hypothetical protein